jgi:hypothetical protein
LFLAVDGAGRRHILVQSPPPQKPIESRDTRGLHVVTEQLRIEDNPQQRFINIVCLDQTQERLFSSLAEDLLEHLRTTTLDENDAVQRTLNRWRAFWAVKSGTLTLELAMGLFGELWFLHQWLGAASYGKWMATPGARHDFQWPEASIEVKTAQAASLATAAHHINSLDQLDDAVTGQLYLFSLLVLEDALAGHTLESLIASISSELAHDPTALEEFTAKLAAYGYIPSDSPYARRPLRIVREALYKVADDFPRVRWRSFPSGVPVGVGAVQYMLYMSACEPWRIATVPTEAAAILRS